MAFPILHSLVGCAIHRAGDNKNWGWEKAVLFAFVASAADLDWIPGILVGHSSLFHRTITHSFAAAIVCSLVTASIARFWKKSGFIKMFLLSFAAYTSHLAVDLFSPWSQPLFWPFQSAHLAQKIQMFQSMPFRWDGLSHFVSRRLLVAWSLHRFEREMICLGGGLFFLTVRAAFRSLPPVFRKSSALTADEAAA